MTERDLIGSPNDDRCPPATLLVDWLSERVSLDDSQRSHVERCASCQSFLDQHSDDQTLRRWKGKSSSKEKNSFLHFDEPEFQAMRGKLAQHLQRATAKAPTQLPAGGVSDTAASEIDTDAIPSESQTDHDEPRSGSFPTSVATYGAETIDLSWVRQRLPADRFKLERVIGKGGNAIVYLAYDSQLRRDVAIKLLVYGSQRNQQRMRREARFMAEIQHASVVPVHDVGELTYDDQTQSDGLYLVMEYIPDGTAQRLTPDGFEKVGFAKDRGGRGKKAKGGEHKTHYHHLADLFATAADGLAAAHERGLVHRDIKPNNLLLDLRTQRLKLADFGLARALDDSATMVTRQGDVMGTPAFMSPEQAMSGGREGKTQGDADVALATSTDIYSLGASLYYCLTGLAPFQGHPAAILRQVVEVTPVAPRLQNTHLPADLETICLKAMDKEAGHRYASAQDFASDLRRFAREEPIHARPPSSWQQFRWFLKRQRALAAALGTVAALLLLLLIVATASAIVFRNQSDDLAQSNKMEQQATARARDATRQTIQAADDLLLSVTEDTQLLPRTVGGQEVSRRLLLKAKAYYQQLLDQHSQALSLTQANQSPSARENDAAVESELRQEIAFDAARARVGLARIAAAMLEHNEVDDEVNSAMTILDTLPENDSAAERLRIEALGILGGSHNKAGNAEEARTAFTNAEKRCRRLIANSPGHQSEVAHGAREMQTEQLGATKSLDFLLATLLRGTAVADTTLGDGEAAQTRLEEAELLVQPMLNVEKENESELLLAANIASSLGVLALDRNGHLASQKHFEVAQERLQKIRSPDGDVSVRIRSRIAENNVYLARITNILGNPEQAAEQFDQINSEFEQLIALEPTVDAHRMGLATAVMNSSQTFMALDRMGELREKTIGANQWMQTHASQGPESLDAMQTRVKLSSNIAILSQLLGQHEAAVKPLIESTRLSRECAQLSGNTPQSVYAISLNEYTLSQCYYELGQVENGLDAIQRSMENTQQILKKHPSFLPARTHQIDELIGECDLLLIAEPFDAERHLESAKSAVAVSAALLEEFDDLVDYEIRHAVVISTLAEAHNNQKQYEQTITVAGGGIDHLNQILGVDSDDQVDLDDQPEDIVLAYFYNHFPRAVAIARQAAQLREENGDPDQIVAMEQMVKASIASCRRYGATEEEIEMITNGSSSATEDREDEVSSDLPPAESDE